MNFDEYIKRLQDVREKGDWEGWLKFFFQGIIEISQEAVDNAKSILVLFAENRQRIESLRTTNTTHKIHEFLQKHPITSIKRLSQNLDISIPSATKALKELGKLGIIKERTGYSRNRLFAYHEYIRLLSEGTKPLESE